MKHYVNYWPKKVAVMLLLLFAVGMFGVPAAAESSDYYLTDNELYSCYMPTAFKVRSTIGTIGKEISLSDAQDLFMSEDGFLYILDSGNARVVKLNQQRQITAVYSGNYGQEALPLKDPEGIFVGARQDLYIADTGNARIVHLDKDGNLLEMFTQPDDSSYDTSYPFRPSKVYVDELGKLYVLNANDYHGIIIIDGSNRFLGYLGATKIDYSFIDSFIRLFATNEQKEQIARTIPAHFSNFLLHDGMIYATSFWDDSNQIKILTPSGDNVYKTKFYGEINDLKTFNYQPGFVDLAVDANGIIYAADMTVNMIYVYDQEGNNLAAIGGIGSRAGKFNSISSLVVDDEGCLYVLDKTLNVVQVLEPTDLMKNILKATTYYYQGQYDEAETYWRAVLESDASNGLANRGLAKSAYRSGNYTEAMSLAKIAQDKEIYSDAFSEYSLDILREYFGWIFLGVVGTVLLMGWGLIRLKRTADEISVQPLTDSDRIGLKGYLKLALLQFYHPIDGYEKMKINRRKISIYPILFCLLALVFIQIGYIYTVHFPVSAYSSTNIDVKQQLVLLFLPLLSWILVNYAVSSIMEGKQIFRETVLASLYSFLPYILLMLPLGLFSHLLGVDERGFYAMLTGLVLVWSVIMLLLSNKVMNEFSFGKMVLIVLITLFGIVCLWMICLLFYIIVSQTLTFFEDIYTDIAMLFYD